MMERYPASNLVVIHDHKAPTYLLPTSTRQNALEPVDFGVNAISLDLHALCLEYLQSLLVMIY
jgi:hypothetical protein